MGTPAIIIHPQSLCITRSVATRKTAYTTCMKESNVAQQLHYLALENFAVYILVLRQIFGLSVLCAMGILIVAGEPAFGGFTPYPSGCLSYCFL